MKKTLKQMDIPELEELLDILDDEKLLKKVERELERRRKPTVHHEKPEDEGDEL
jgi:hypothetical protein